MLLYMQVADATQLGYDFWMTQNGHGVGFWDRGMGELRDRLTVNAEGFWPADVFINDNDELVIE